jgi:hypothetical protein
MIFGGLILLEPMFPPHVDDLSGARYTYAHRRLGLMTGSKIDAKKEHISSSRRHHSIWNQSKVGAGRMLVA